MPLALGPTMCTAGNIFVGHGGSTETDGLTTFTLGHVCTECGRRFPRLVVRETDNLAYLPSHRPDATRQ